MMHDGDASGQRAAKNELASRARRLFEFLAQVQSIRSSPVYSYVSYRRQEPGDVIIFNDLPSHASVRAGLDQNGHDLPLLSVERTPLTDAPEPPEPQWVEGSWTSPSDLPQISSELTADPSGDPQTLEERSALEESLKAWLEDWTIWALNETEARKARALYERCFRLHNLMEQASDSSELVLGVALLTWIVEGQTVARHVFTAPVETRMEAKSGRIDFVLSGTGLREELDMLSPALRPPLSVLQELHERLRRFAGYPLDEQAVASLAKSLVHRISPDGEYDSTHGVPTPTTHPVVSFTPMLIQRRRTNRGIEKILSAIAERIDETGEVPAGLLSIVDPDSAPEPEPLSREGGLIRLDDDIFAPLPLNSVQEQIIERVNARVSGLSPGSSGYR